MLQKKIKNNNFQVPDELDRFLAVYCSFVAYFLLNSPKKNVEPVLPSIHFFLSDFTELCHLAPFSQKVAHRIVDILNSLKVMEFDYLAYGELLLGCANVIIEAMKDFSTERFSRILFIMSRLNFSNYSKPLYDKFIEATIQYIITNEKKFTVEQWKSNLYALGLNALITPELERILIKFLEIDDLRAKSTYSKYPVYLKNLLLNVTSNFVLTKENPKFKEVSDYLIDKVRMHDKKSEFYDLVSFVKIAISFRRAEFLDVKFWKAFLSIVPQALESGNKLDFDLFFIFKSFDLFAKHSESKEEYAEIGRLLSEYAQKNKDIYNQVMNFDIKELASSFPDKGRLEDTSGLQHQIRLYLTGNFKFEEEAKADFMVVDFLLPEKNIVIESQGPIHFLKPNSRLNMLTEFKLKCLHKLGYGVISIPYNVDVSLDYFLVESMNKLK